MLRCQALSVFGKALRRSLNKIGMVPAFLPLGNSAVDFITSLKNVKPYPMVSVKPGRTVPLKVHKIENFFDSDFGICVISLLVISKY